MVAIKMLNEDINELKKDLSDVRKFGHIRPIVSIIF